MDERRGILPVNEPVLTVQHLSVQVATAHGGKTVLDDISFDLFPGEVLCLAGESGSGKSMTALAIMGLLPAPMARISSGRILLGDKDIVNLSERDLRRVRASRIAMIFQEPMTSLNPVMTIGDQLVEVLLEHGTASRSATKQMAMQLLHDVRMTSPEKRLRQYPHELSGGMRQRVMIAMALSCNPEILIADEPTTALDVTVQAEILDLIRKLKSQIDAAVIMITHDMGVVAEMADRVIVMKEGRQVETASVQSLFATPTSEYTRELLAAVPRLGSVRSGEAQTSNTSTSPVSVVDVQELSVRFSMRGGLLNRRNSQLHAVERVSFSIARGETLALVGESGSGKSTIGKALLSLVPFDGTVHISGKTLAGLNSRKLQISRRDIQMIFQDPYASLDPRMTVRDQVAEPLLVHGLARGSDLDDRVEWLFERVGLSKDHLKRHPLEFSGGQRQRICVARALALNPKVIVADECVSALDVSVQARVLELLQELQAEEGVAFLFISHDMAVVEQISHRVAVLYAGQIVEYGSRTQLFGNPQHPYTKKLLSAVPIPDPTIHREPFIRDNDEPTNSILPLGQRPVRQLLNDVGGGHWVATTG